jgi:hypothetical protein
MMDVMRGPPMMEREREREDESRGRRSVSVVEHEEATEISFVNDLPHIRNTPPYWRRAMTDMASF